MDQVLIQLVMDAQGEVSLEYLADLVPKGGWFTLELSACYEKGQWKTTSIKAGLGLRKAGRGLRMKPIIVV